MSSWREFRDSLESSEDPFREIINLYKQAPFVRVHTDPWDQKTWPDPWELLFENKYCEFCTVLGICYSLQLTERFKDSSFEIHISKNSELSEIYYLLFVDNVVIDYGNDAVVPKKDLPEALFSQRIYAMPRLQ